MRRGTRRLQNPPAARWGSPAHGSLRPATRSEASAASPVSTGSGWAFCVLGKETGRAVCALTSQKHVHCVLFGKERYV